MTNKPLNPTNVHGALMDCFFSSEFINEHVSREEHEGRIEYVFDEVAKERGVDVRGAMLRLFLDKEKLETHRADVVSWLNELDPKFKEGWSLMQAVATKDGELWGEQRDADALFTLAQALGLAEPTMPRELWHALPGCMPYYTVL